MHVPEGCPEELVCKGSGQFIFIQEASVDCPFTPEVSVDCPFIPEGCPEELYEDALPGLDGGGLVGEGGLEEGGDDVC